MMNAQVKIIKPCPCGSRARAIHAKGFWIVRCPECGRESFVWISRSAAVDAWNAGRENDLSERCVCKAGTSPRKALPGKGWSWAIPISGRWELVYWSEPTRRLLGLTLPKPDPRAVAVPVEIRVRPVHRKGC